MGRRCELGEDEYLQPTLATGGPGEETAAFLAEGDPLGIHPCLLVSSNSHLQRGCSTSSAPKIETGRIQGRKMGTSNSGNRKVANHRIHGGRMLGRMMGRNRNRKFTN